MAHDHHCLPKDRQPIADGVWHFGAAVWQAGCRRTDSQIEPDHRAQLRTACQLKLGSQNSSCNQKTKPDPPSL